MNFLIFNFGFVDSRRQFADLGVGLLFSVGLICSAFFSFFQKLLKTSGGGNRNMVPLRSFFFEVASGP